MTTNAYAAKRAIIDRLTAETTAAGRLPGWQVLYAFHGASLTNKCIYGGGVVFEPTDEEAVDGRSRMFKERATVGIHIRVAQSPPGFDGIRDTDILAEQVGDIIAELFAEDPHLAGGHSVSEVAGGQGDYSPNDDSAITTLSLRIGVDSWVTTERQTP